MIRGQGVLCAPSVPVNFDPTTGTEPPFLEGKIYID